MKLSLIVPAYNAQDCLGNCLDDLVNQSIDDYEIIVVNDGSTDDTEKIISEYKGMYPDVVRSITISNGGQGRARNFAIRVAKGDYIGFADADDRLDHDMFKKMYDKAVSEDADIVVCDFFRSDAEGNHYERAQLQDHPLSSAGPVWNKIFRASVIGGIRFAEGLWYEDFTFSCKMLIKSKKTVFINEALYYYSVGHTSTMTNQNALKNLDILTVMDGIKAYANKEKPDTDIDFLIINHILLESIKRVSLQDSPDKKIVLKKLRSYVNENIPDLDKSCAFKNESRNRKIIMKLNYYGFEGLSKAILKIK